MKAFNRHGISIGIERVNSDFFLYFKAIGQLSHGDYDQITPLINLALEGIDDPQVKVLMDASEFQGWELRAAWDDFKLGLKHGSEFSKVAIVGADKWLKVASRIASWFVSGEVQYFDDTDAALEWLAAVLPEKGDEKTAAADGSDRWENPSSPAHS